MRKIFIEVTWNQVTQAAGNFITEDVEVTVVVDRAARYTLLLQKSLSFIVDL